MAANETEGMTAREMNIALALFMGWHRWTDLDNDYDGPFPMFAAWDDDVSTIAVYEDDASGDVTRYWCPTADITDAWEVVERLTLPQIKQLTDKRWRVVYIVSREPELIIASASADTAPLAICRAALAL